MSIAITWGTTAEEHALGFPCDGIIDTPVCYWRGVTVDAPPATVFRWLCQLRAAPYSYDWIDNLGRRSPQHLTPDLDQLAVGQRVMYIFDLVSFERDRHITVRLRRGGIFGKLLGDGAVSYAISSTDGGGTRLLAKLAVRYPRGPVGWFMRAGLPWGDLVMMRRQLLNLKGLAERDSHAEAQTR